VNDISRFFAAYGMLIPQADPVSGSGKCLNCEQHGLIYNQAFLSAIHIAFCRISSEFKIAESDHLL
jgi:hypothetical protein